MTTPLSTIFQGDVTLQQGTDIVAFGYGDLDVARRAVIKGTANSTSPTSATLVVYGGMSVGLTANIYENLNVLFGITNLTETHIDTTNGPCTVTGGNKFDVSVGASSQLVSTNGNLLLSSQTQQLQIYAGQNSTNAVNILTGHLDGGINLLSGSGNGKIALTSGAGGIYGTTSNGNIILTANNANGSFVVNSASSNQNLVIANQGQTDSQLRIETDSTNATQTAMIIQTTNTNGSISISNANGLGSGSISQLTGSGGFTVRTNTSGPISITAQAASATFNVDSNAADQDLTVALNNSTDSAVVIKSAGSNTTKTALTIQTTNTAGNITILQPSLSYGNVSITTGNNGFGVVTQTGGSINMLAYGATSSYVNKTVSDNQHLYISVQANNNNSRVIIDGQGNSSNAVTIQATNNSGGVYITGNNTVQLESNDTNNGVSIATLTPGIPVKIGSTNSTTTVYGNLDVKGVTTTIESQVLTVVDNIIVVNNAPAGSSDGGLAVKRYQYANDISAGDVVQDTAEESGTTGSSGNSLTTFQLASGANSTNNYYNGWWVKFTSGTGSGQVRRIKSYDGSSRIATIYTTSDQTINNVAPVEGLDFVTIPDNTSAYSLYPCHYVMNIWDESNDEWAFICSSTNPDEQVNISHYSDLHVGDLTASSVVTNVINGNAADISTTVTLNDGNTLPVTITAFPNNYGIYQVFVKPQTNTTRTHAIFVIGRVNATGTPGSTNRIMSAKGAQSEQLFIDWPADSLPALVYRPNPLGGSGTTVYNVKIVSL